MGSHTKESEFHSPSDAFAEWALEKRWLPSKPHLTFGSHASDAVAPAFYAAGLLISLCGFLFIKDSNLVICASVRCFAPSIPALQKFYEKSRATETHFHVTITKLSGMILGKKLIECWHVILNPGVCFFVSCLHYIIDVSMWIPKWVCINTIIFFLKNSFIKILL